MSDFNINKTGPTQPPQETPPSWSEKGKLYLKNGARLIANASNSITKHFKRISVLFADKMAYYFASAFRLRKRKYYAARLAHDDYDMREIWAKKKYGGKLISPTRNIAAREVLKTEKDRIAAENILDDIHLHLRTRDKAHTPEMQEALEKIRENTLAEADPQYCKRDGICAGLCLFAAQRFLEKENIEDIAKQLSKGSGEEGAANQAVFHALTTKFPSSFEILDMALEHMSFSMLQKGELTKGDMIEVALALKELYGIHEKNGEFIDMIREVKDDHPEKFSRKEDLDAFEIRVFSQINGLYNSNCQTLGYSAAGQIRNKHFKQWDVLKTLLEVQCGYNHVVESLSQKTPLPPLNRLWERVRGLAIKLFGQGQDFSMLKKSLDEVLDHVSDKELCHELKINEWYRLEQQKMAPIGVYRNCRYKKILSMGGPPGAAKTDDEFLSHLKNLNRGVYQVIFMTDAGAHATTYFVNQDKSGVFFDPNIGFIKCRNPDDAQNTIKDVLKSYPQPKIRRPNLIKGDSDHHLMIFQVESIQPEST